jgi:hypothetical protein
MPAHTESTGYSSNDDDDSMHPVKVAKIDPILNPTSNADNIDRGGAHAHSSTASGEDGSESKADKGALREEQKEERKRQKEYDDFIRLTKDDESLARSTFASTRALEAQVKSMK